jgi:hypothetical protein
MYPEAVSREVLKSLKSSSLLRAASGIQRTDAPAFKERMRHPKYGCLTPPNDTRLFPGMGAGSKDVSLAAGRRRLLQSLRSFANDILKLSGRIKSS